MLQKLQNGGLTVNSGDWLFSAQINTKSKGKAKKKGGNLHINISKTVI